MFANNLTPSVSSSKSQVNTATRQLITDDLRRVYKNNWKHSKVLSRAHWSNRVRVELGHVCSVHSANKPYTMGKERISSRQQKDIKDKNDINIYQHNLPAGLCTIPGDCVARILCVFLFFTFSKIKQTTGMFQ